MMKGCVPLALLLTLTSPALAQQASGDPADEPAVTEGENASNPLAAVNNTDIRLQYTDIGEAGRRFYDAFIDGAVMLN